MNDPPLPISFVSAGVVPAAEAPLPSYIWMRVFADGDRELRGSTPILSSTHSSASTLPVEMAVSGMSPSKDVRGMTSWRFFVVVQGGM